MDEMSQSAVPSAASATLDSLLTQSSLGMRETERPTCCCGRMHCAYLDHNNAALEGLEKDLQSAAQIGQVRLHLLRILAIHVLEPLWLPLMSVHCQRTCR